MHFTIAYSLHKLSELTLTILTNLLTSGKIVSGISSRDLMLTKDPELGEDGGALHINCATKSTFCVLSLKE